MKITRLELSQYRNYEKISVQLDYPICVFMGENAQGKTNLLESIYVAATGKSFRTSKDSDLIRWNESFTHIHLDYWKKDIRHRISLSLAPNEKRYKLDDKKLDKRSQLFGQLAIVLFTPDDLNLVKGEPATRRRFLDFEISQTSPSYLYSLQRYYRVLKQRNTALRDAKYKKSSIELVRIWNSQLAQYGAEIIHARQNALFKLNQTLDGIFPEVSGKTSQLTLIYKTFLQDDLLLDLNSLKKKFLDKLIKMEHEELARGTTLMGPQRDDFEVLLNQRSIHDFGSQGEQRSAVLALKLSEIYFIQEEIGDFPVILLDDFTSELDDSHVISIIRSLPRNLQILITSVHTLPHPFSDADVRYYLIKEGQLAGKGEPLPG